ncbi:hypothetical protein BofuT4_P065590.1 [Botrytis cinerea T4]|uniref:Uncharacterized protein n=1 Tax=Botryotinia fuckeliana (strain T4) TaxID=999810 RepID=G2XS01_BOTF4|nr:hypothetical protein BofuT4_P065590.1 [Botrytis cinerea T4]
MHIKPPSDRRLYPFHPFPLPSNSAKTKSNDSTISARLSGNLKTSTITYKTKHELLHSKEQSQTNSSPSASCSTTIPSFY